MTTLLHLDLEFTNPEPGFGEIMEAGFASHSFDFEKLRAGDPSFMSEDVLEGRIQFGIKKPWRASPWVLDNQPDLLLRSSRIRDADGPNDVFTLLERTRRKFGGPIVLAGWCVASDLLMLRAAVPHYPHFHHRTIELEDLMMGLFGITDLQDEDIASLLGVKRQPKSPPHDALEDVRFQAKAVRAALIEVQKRNLKAKEPTT